MQNQEEQAVLFMLQKQLEGWEKGFTRAQPGPTSVDPCPRRAVNQASTSAQCFPGIPPSARLVFCVEGTGARTRSFV